MGEPQKTARYIFMIRDQAAYTKPTTTTEFGTLEATFTEIGKFKDQSLEFPITPEGGTVLDDGNRFVDEGKIVLKNEIFFNKENETALSAKRNQRIDILCKDRKNECHQVIPDVFLTYGETAKHGDYGTFSLDIQKIDDFEALKSKIFVSDLT